VNWKVVVFPSFIAIWRRLAIGMSKSSKGSGQGLPMRFWLCGPIWRSIPCSVVKNIPAQISVGDIRKKFPYKVVYSVEEEKKTVVVIALIHAARHERVLRKRTQGL
jgi:hypothetical protein